MRQCDILIYFEIGGILKKLLSADHLLSRTTFHSITSYFVLNRFFLLAKA